MKTRQFINEIEEMGYYTMDKPSSNVRVVKQKGAGAVLGAVSTKDRFVLDTNYTGFMGLSEIDRSDLLDVLENYANTPVEDRVEPKRYQLKLFIPALTTNAGGQYLNFDRGNRTYKLNNKSETDSYQTIFTEAELSGIDETGFIREEVTTNEN